MDLFDELGHGHLPGLLAGVGQVTELLRIQSQLSGHLDASIGKMEALSRLDPGLELFWYLLLRHASLIQRKRYNVAEEPVRRNGKSPKCEFRTLEKSPLL